MGQLLPVYGATATPHTYTKQTTSRGRLQRERVPFTGVSMCSRRVHRLLLLDQLVGPSKNRFCNTLTKRFGGELAISTPMRHIRSGRCARVASGHAAAPPTSPMNSRRLTRSTHQPSTMKGIDYQTILYCAVGIDAPQCARTSYKVGHEETKIDPTSSTSSMSQSMRHSPLAIR